MFLVGIHDKVNISNISQTFQIIVSIIIIMPIDHKYLLFSIRCLILVY
jgi:hypothetical protein